MNVAIIKLSQRFPYFTYTCIIDEDIFRIREELYGVSLDYYRKNKKRNLLRDKNTLTIIKQLKENNVTSVKIELKPGVAGNWFNFEMLKEANIDVLCIKDLTPIPHNGARKAKMVLSNNNKRKN